VKAHKRDPANAIPVSIPTAADSAEVSAAMNGKAPPRRASCHKPLSLETVSRRKRAGRFDWDGVEIMAAEYPRCKKCDGKQYTILKSIISSDGSTTQRRECACGERYVVVWE
jgi:hypothetical protein